MQEHYRTRHDRSDLKGDTEYTHRPVDIPSANFDISCDCINLAIREHAFAVRIRRLGPIYSCVDERRPDSRGVLDDHSYSEGSDGFNNG
jgi:hypothetical protein